MRSWMVTEAVLRCYLSAECYGEDFFRRIDAAAEEKYGINYTWRLTGDGGFVLTPRWRLRLDKMGNSFWPEVTGRVCQEESGTVLRLSCRPVEFVRVFVWCCAAFLLLVLAVGIPAAVKEGEYFLLAVTVAVDLIFPLVFGVAGRKSAGWIIALIRQRGGLA